MKTQQALGEIFVQNRPIQGLFLPIFCFRQLPSASVSFRRGPCQVGPACLDRGDLLPDPDFCARQNPSASVSFRRGPCPTARHVWILPTSFCALMMSGEHIWKLNRAWAKFTSQIDRFKGCFSQFSASASFRLLPSASAGVRFRLVPTSLARCDRRRVVPPEPIALWIAEPCAMLGKCTRYSPQRIGRSPHGGS